MKSKTVHARHIPLLEIRKRLLARTAKYMRKRPEHAYECMTDEELNLMYAKYTNKREVIQNVL